MLRRGVAAAAAVVLAGQAVVMVLLQTFLGMVVDAQRMSLAGLDPDVVSRGSLVGGIVVGTYLLGCSAALALTAVRDRAPGRVARILLVGVAVLHTLLAALTVGLAGWLVFGLLMLVVALVVGTLTAYARGPEHRRDEPPPSAAVSEAPTAR